MLNGYFEYAVDANSIVVPFADSKNLGEATVIGQTSRGGSHGPTNDGRGQARPVDQDIPVRIAHRGRQRVPLRWCAARSAR